METSKIEAKASEKTTKPKSKSTVFVVCKNGNFVCTLATKAKAEAWLRAEAGLGDSVPCKQTKAGLRIDGLHHFAVKESQIG